MGEEPLLSCSSSPFEELLLPLAVEQSDEPRLTGLCCLSGFSASPDHAMMVPCCCADIFFAGESPEEDGTFTRTPELSTPSLSHSQHAAPRTVSRVPPPVLLD